VMPSRIFAIALAVWGAVITARMALGENIGFRSPLNVESAFGFVAIAGLVLRSQLEGGRGVGWKCTPRDAALGATIAILTAPLFWRSASFGFLSDDFVLLKLARTFQGNYRGVFTTGGGDGFFRPLGYISLAWTSAWAGVSPVAWHWVGIALHMASSI